MLSIQLRSKLPDTWVKAQVGRRARPEDFSLLVTGSARVYKPNGELLLALVRGGLSEESCAAAYPFLHWLRHYRTMNRGAYGAEERFYTVKRDGTRSNTDHAVPVRSAIVGFFDRHARFPYCREANFSSRHPEEWGACLPMIQEASGLLQRIVPKRFAAQQAAASQTHQAYVIPGTAFTTVTVNNTVAGGYHTDAGDFKPGFGVMSVLRRGTYTGGLLVIPAYGVAVDLEDRDVILFDVHEVHGNTPIVGEGLEGSDHERISVVYYFREKMVDCLSPDQELARAKGTTTEEEATEC